MVSWYKRHEGRTTWLSFLVLMECGYIFNCLSIKVLSLFTILAHCQWKTLELSMKNLNKEVYPGECTVWTSIHFKPKSFLLRRTKEEIIWKMSSYIKILLSTLCNKQLITVRLVLAVLHVCWETFRPRHKAMAYIFRQHLIFLQLTQEDTEINRS